MRTDFKIGIAVGLFVLIVAAVYFGVHDLGKPKEVTDTTEAPAPEVPPRVRTEHPADTESISVDSAAPERIPEGEISTTRLPVPIVEPRFEGELTGDLTRTEGERSSAGTDADNAGATADRDRTITPVTPSATPWALRPDATDITSLPRARTEQFYSDVQRTYIVQHGDNGFWTAAARMYGHGRYFGVIAEANPNVDSTALHPGRRLIVPPLPQKYRLQAVKPAPTPDTIRGERIYVVQKGDAGFWGVSVKVYGHGKYYKEIAKANAGVDSENLKAGQKLLIPPKPRQPAAPGALVTGIGAEELPSGYRIYVVRRGDAGFWDVAIKMYGNGQRFGLVAKANPGVDSLRLQPGQKLRIPPLSQAGRLAGAATAPVIEEHPGEIWPVSADRRPVFD